MKRIIALITVLVLALIPLNSFAFTEKSYRITIGADDLSGENFQEFFMGCSGHYDADNDIATVYITNTSSSTGTFQFHIGYSGTTEKPTSISSTAVALEPGKTAQLSVSELKNAYEKANDGTYNPNRTLSESSVVRISAKGLKAGETFTVSGMAVTSAKNTYFKETSNYAEIKYDSSIISSADTTVKAATPEPSPFGYTLTQPSQTFVNKFIAFIGVSAVLCAGGIIIYTVSAIIKRRKTND